MVRLLVPGLVFGNPIGPTRTLPADSQFSDNTRKHYIAAEEVYWDYAPSGWDNWLRFPLRYSPRAQSAGYTDYGAQWRKAVYRGYTDGSFIDQDAPSRIEWQGT